MNRRSFVAALAAGLPAVAGCVGDPGTGTPADDTDDPTDSPRDGPTDDPAGGDDPVGPGRTDLVDLGTAARTYALSPTRYREDWVTVGLRFVSTATADGPATVRATVANGSEYDDTVPVDWKPPFGRAVSAAPRPPGARHGDDDHTYRAALVFAPAPDNPLVASPPGVERDADGLWRATEVDDWTPDPLRLGPGESVTADYHLVGHPDGAGDGRPTGVYGFTRDEEPSVTVAVWDTDRPGPDGESRFAGVAVPPLPGDATTAWYHEADPTARSFLRPETERTDLPAAVSFTFVNHGREPTRCGHWGVYKLVDGEWFDLGPSVHTADCRVVDPGGAKRFVLRAFHGPGLETRRLSGRRRTLGHLGGGRYAVGAGYGADSDRSATLLGVDAPAVVVRPTDDLSTERDGDSLVATGPRHGDTDHPRVLQAVRVDGAGRRLLPEQAMARRGVRNTVSFLAADPELEMVRLRTDRGVVDRATRWAEGPFRFRLDGTAYELAASSP